MAYTQGDSDVLHSKHFSLSFQLFSRHNVRQAVKMSVIVTSLS